MIVGAVLGADMALFVPQTVLPDLFVHHRDRSRLSPHTLRSMSTFPSSTDATCSSSHRERPCSSGSSSSRRNLQCAAVTGGSKRDAEKLVARTQHVRPRHRKGMTPSKNDLLEELEREEEGEEEVENEVAQLVSEDITSTDSNGSSVGEGELSRDFPAKKNTFEGMSNQEPEGLRGVSETYVGNATNSPTNSRVKNVANDAADGAKAILETTEDTVTGVVDIAADTQKQVVSDASETYVGDATNSPTDSRAKNVVNDAAEGAKAILETTEDTVTGVVDIAADTQKQVVSDAVKGGESLVGGVNDAVNNQSTSPSSELQRRADEVKDSTEAITDVTKDTALYIGSKIDETGQQVRQDMAESASSMGEVFDSQTNNAINDAINAFSEQANEVETSVNSVADVTRDTTEYVNIKISETGKQLGQDLAEVASTGQSLFEDGSQAMSQQAKEAERILKEEGSLLEQGASRIQNEASESLERIQDSVQKAIQESAKAARTIGMEALGMGELLVDTAKETIQATSTFTENKGSKDGVTPKERENGSLSLKSQPQESQQEDTSQFADFNVLVAGASGQTGRLIVENLVSKGASVRALVRDINKARSIQQLKDCDFIEADLYKYETVKKAIGDCNVIICAIGARAFPLDPFSTYQVEYEGVLNLISAARNQGKVKKFILISTIGVTYLQLVPLLFWKKQAELYLQRSGLDYTIVRPGGLRNRNEPEDVVMQGADSQFFGGISRRKVAEICVSALTSSGASDKVVEVVSVPGHQKRSIDDLFKLV